MWLTGCTAIYDYEYQYIAKLCGGYDKIKVVWVDLTTVKGKCLDGTTISTDDTVSTKENL